jgi:DNA (cytosine-5)-methyltransferase 1
MKINGHHTFPKTFAEFFAGIGLMRIGLEQAGWEVKFANDIDPLKERLYNNNFKDVENHFHLGDVHEISGNDIPAVTLATASFPCTDLSLAGRREGLSGSQSSAFWGFVKVLDEMRDRKPPIILLENVEGFLTSNGGKDFHEALQSLNKLGYSVDSCIIDAAKFVPQSRVRLFIVGTLSACKEIFFREPNTLFFQSELRTRKLADFIFTHPEIDWNVRDLPGLPKRKNQLSDIVEKLDHEAKEWWDEERVTYLLNQTFDRHRSIIESAKEKPFYSYFTAFRRIRNGRSMAEIRSDGIAGCLRTPKGGSARQILLQIGKGQIKIRFLTPVECARLMGVDNFNITGTFNDALFGFGDAVCVPVVKWLADNYLTPVVEELNRAKFNEILDHGQKTTLTQYDSCLV